MDKKELVGVIERMEKELAVARKRLEEADKPKAGDYGTFNGEFRFIVEYNGSLAAFNSAGIQTWSSNISNDYHGFTILGRISDIMESQEWRVA